MFHSMSRMIWNSCGIRLTHFWVAGAGAVDEILREAGSRLKGRFVWRDYRAGSLVEDIVMLHT